MDGYFGSFLPLETNTRPSATPAVRIRQNANAIITITRALAIQIDAKLEDLHQQKRNDPDSIAARDVAISEYEELRKRVAQLEAEVAKLKGKNPKTAPAVKAGTVVGKTVAKFMESTARWSC